ncbi:mucin TcMUCII [Trypanosoma cruzi]|nr:mucin TcMUCII [Trypanosoma cruzi]
MSTKAIGSCNPSGTARHTDSEGPGQMSQSSPGRSEDDTVAHRGGPCPEKVTVNTQLADAATAEEERRRENTDATRKTFMEVSGQHRRPPPEQMLRQLLATVTAAPRSPSPLPHFASCLCCCCRDGDCACMKWRVLRAREGQRKLHCPFDEYCLQLPRNMNSRGVRGLLFSCFIAFLLLWAPRLHFCVKAVCERCGHDRRSRHVQYMWWGLVCRPCWSLPPPSVCCSRCMTVCVCVCLLPRIGVCVVRGVRRTVHAWLLLSRLVWYALCVRLPHLSSLLLSIFLTVQISPTPLNDHTHDDDDVPSAMRPVGARRVLLPVRERDSEW